MDASCLLIGSADSENKNERCWIRANHRPELLVARRLFSCGPHSSCSTGLDHQKKKEALVDNGDADPTCVPTRSTHEEESD